MIGILQLVKFDGNIGADLSVVLYEGDVCKSLRKEIGQLAFCYYFKCVGVSVLAAFNLACNVTMLQIIIEIKL